ncbi:hypothetical protein JKF63_02279 [Porcisia hertigi]|uniref:DNA repair protein RAD51 homolog 3 n=1 Tax=Porcisia hertigi TaxID=2761500 RepID=A0A836HLZ5_9TRYP|nr:hypothetical protein JKF63_02279 [Porcisia hertigi]
MALIECAESLSSSTKAKLQDAGILYVADVVNLLSAKGVSAGGDSDSPQPSVNRNLGTLFKQHVSQPHLPPQSPPRLDPVKDTEEAIDEERRSTEILQSTVVTPRSALRDASAALRFLSLTEEEVEEIVDMALRATTVVDGVHGRHVDLTSTVQGGVCAHHGLTSSQQHSPVSLLRTDTAGPGAGKRGLTGGSLSHGIPGCRTLGEVLAEMQTRQAQGSPTHVTTFSRELDRVLGGGVPVGGVTEISGPPGVGKTQLLMQLAVSCSMPIKFGGMGGACLFVDTEGSFVAERLEQMATAAVSLVRSILLRQPQQSHKAPSAPTPSVTRQAAQAHKKRPRSPTLDSHTVAPAKSGCSGMRNGQDSEEEFSVETVLRCVHYVRITDLPGLVALLHSIPPWLERERSDEAQTISSKGRLDTSAPSSRQQRSSASGPLTAVKMILIDSVALPFRSFEGFHREGLSTTTGAGGSSGESVMHHLHYAGRNAAQDGPALQPTWGLLSKHGLWQRSRLLFQVSTLLEQLAATYQLAVLVTNHMTTKTLRGTPVHGTTTGSAKGKSISTPSDTEACPGQFHQSVLVPALGDAWGHGLCTRLLLSYHHYNVPNCGFMDRPTSPTAATDCTEDIVYSLSADQHQHSTGLHSVVQHRVVRVLKCSGQPRQEACFLVTSKGIRDVRRDMVSKRVSRGLAPKEPFS